MRKIIMIVIAMVFANSVQAMTEHEVADYIRSTVPGISDTEANWCADAHRNGGKFVVKIHDVTLKCEKNSIIKDWDR